MSQSESSGLFAYSALERAVIVRAPTYQRHLDAHVCAECGADVGSAATVRLPVNAVVDDHTRARFERRGEVRVLAHGRICKRHGYDVAMPTVVSRASAPGMPDGWLGVELRFADGVTRHVAVPEREVMA